MIKPYNQPQNKITKENSMFNYLPEWYKYYSVEHQKYIYEGEIIFQTNIPKNVIENKIRFNNYQFCEHKQIIINRPEINNLVKYCNNKKDCEYKTNERFCEEELINKNKKVGVSNIN